MLEMKRVWDDVSICIQGLGVWQGLNDDLLVVTHRYWSHMHQNDALIDQSSGKLDIRWPSTE